MLQLVTGIFLGYAINWIRKQLKSGDNPAEVDVRILAVHATAFGLYMISIIVSFILLAYYYLVETANGKASLYSDILSITCSFVA